MQHRVDAARCRRRRDEVGTDDVRGRREDPRDARRDRRHRLEHRPPPRRRRRQRRRDRRRSRSAAPTSGSARRSRRRERSRPRRSAARPLIAPAYAERARRAGAVALETIVTAPGRQGDAAEALVERARGGDRDPDARRSRSDDEGRLAYEGAVHAHPPELEDVVGVVDVGGGSSEVVVGTPSLGAAWIRSLDIGSLRLATRGSRATPRPRRRVRAARRRVRRGGRGARGPQPGRRARLRRQRQGRGRVARPRRSTSTALDGRDPALLDDAGREARADATTCTRTAAVRSSPGRSSSASWPWRSAARSSSPAAGSARAPHSRSPGPRRSQPPRHGRFAAGCRTFTAPSPPCFPRPGPAGPSCGNPPSGEVDLELRRCARCR